jgi:hypothetical protein
VTTPLFPPAERAPGTVLARRLLMAAAAAVVLAAIAYLLMVRTRLGQRFDNAALLGSRQQAPLSRLHDAFFLERIRTGTFIAVLVVIVIIGVVRRRPRAGLALAAAAFLAVLCTDLAKNDILTRPVLVQSDVVLGSNTFPSGHTATAIGCALALVVLSSPAVRGLVAVLVGPYAWIVAEDVQSAGWHRPSDAIAGSLLTFATIAIAAAALAWKRPIGTRTPVGHWVAFPVLAVAGIVSGVLTAESAARALKVLTHTVDSANPHGALLNEAYEFSVNLTVLVVVCLLITLLLLLGDRDLDQPAPA